MIRCTTKRLAPSLLAVFAAAACSSSTGGTVDGSTPFDSQGSPDGGGRDAAADGRKAKDGAPDVIVLRDGRVIEVGNGDAPGAVDGGHDGGHPGCTSSSQCDAGTCMQGMCVPPSCMDGKKDGSETDVDCGGPCPACGTGLHCLDAHDCASLDCTGVTGDAALPSTMPGTCKAASCTDMIQNEGETDVDCGGMNCMPCAAGKKCKANTDCTSDGCNYLNVCATAPSCTQHHGGDTCGAAEDTTLGPNATMSTPGEDNCCATIPIPGTSMTLDKYMITAGRFRAFVNRFSGNLRSFTASIPASNTNWNPAWNQYIPSTTTEVDLQLGPWPAPLTPNPYPPTDTMNDADGLPAGNWLGQWRDGCTMGKPGAPDGARTWWTASALHGDVAAIQYPQDYLDDKIINCIDSYVLTAFCIWDGGHLETDAEMSAAWGPGPLPWSAVAPTVLIDQTTQKPSGMDSMGRTAASYMSHEFGLTPDEFVAPFTYTYDPYNMLVDNSVHIPPPGRFPLGAGPYGHMDLAGASYEATSIKPGTITVEPPTPTPTSVKQVDHVGTLEKGSWEIHPVITGSGTAVMYDPWMPAYWAYWAMTSRCGR